MFAHSICHWHSIITHCIGINSLLCVPFSQLPEEYQSTIKTLQIKFCQLLWSVQDLLPNNVYVIHGNMPLRNTYAVLKPKLYNFASNTYLSTKPLFFSTFMISKMHIVAKKPRKRQLNASESAILVILSLLWPLCSTKIILKRFKCSQ